MEHFNFNIKQEEINETLDEEVSFDLEDLEIVKNEDLVRKMCTDELNIKDELENKDEMINATFNYTEDEIDNCDYHLDHNNAGGIAEVDITIIKENNSSIQTSNTSDDGSIKYSFGRQCLDSFKKTSANETLFKGFPSVSTCIDKKLYYCEICNYNNIRKYYLSNLVKKCDRNYHTMFLHKLFECTICDYKCRQKSDFVRHIYIHTGEKPFQCSICNYKCALKSSLVSHMKIHTEEKSFECSVCDYICARKSQLVTHMHNHTGEKPFVCRACDCKFALKSCLVTHMRIHTGEKPFECSVCDYKFSQKYRLTRHMRVHTGEKPYECAFCHYKCARKDSLVGHMKKHTDKRLLKCGNYKCTQKKV